MVRIMRKFKLRYQTFSLSNINKYCLDIKSDFGGVNTFGYLFNCLSDKKVFKTESKSFFIDVNNNFTVIEITDIVKN